MNALFYYSPKVYHSVPEIVHDVWIQRSSTKRSLGPSVRVF